MSNNDMQWPFQASLSLRAETGQSYLAKVKVSSIFNANTGIRQVSCGRYRKPTTKPLPRHLHMYDDHLVLLYSIEEVDVHDYE